MTNKEIKNENKTEHKKEEKEELKKVYLVDYYIRDLTLGKYLETNIFDQLKDKHANDNIVVFKGEKPILEGMGNLFPKVESAITELKNNEEKTLKLTAIDAYGLRNKEMVRVVPIMAFKENKINPMVGLTFEADGMYGTIKSVSGGRVLVDFNSPYADHDIEVYVRKIKTLNETEAINKILETFFAKTEAKLKSFANEKITIEMKILEGQNKEMYTQIFEGFLKSFVNFKEIVIEAKN